MISFMFTLMFGTRARTRTWRMMLWRRPWIWSWMTSFSFFSFLHVWFLLNSQLIILINLLIISMHRSYEIASIPTKSTSSSSTSSSSPLKRGKRSTMNWMHERMMSILMSIKSIMIRWERRRTYYKPRILMRHLISILMLRMNISLIIISRMWCSVIILLIISILLLVILLLVRMLPWLLIGLMPLLIGYKLLLIVLWRRLVPRFFGIL